VLAVSVADARALPYDRIMTITGSRRRVTVLACVALVLGLAGCDWAQLGFGPDRRNHNPYEPALTAATFSDLAPAWSKACACNDGSRGDRGAGVVVSGGIVYTLDGSTLRAFDAATGATRWSAVVGSNVDVFGVGNGLVYLRRRPEGGTHRLEARDAVTGVSRFAFTPQTVDGSPIRITDVLVDGGLAFVAGFAAVTGATPTTVYAVAPNGGLVWARAPGGFGNRLVADPGRTVYVGTSIPVTSGTSFESGLPLLTGFSQSTGAVVSAAVVQVTSAYPQEARAFANGLVYTFSPGGHGLLGAGLSAVDPVTGQVRWRDAPEPIALAPDVLVARSEPGMSGKDPVTGEQLWSRPDLGPGGGGPAVGELLLRVEGGTLVAQRLSDGVDVGTVAAAGDRITGVAVSDGRIFVTTPTRLIAIEPGPGTAVR
jgi:outer membrane protein assembly factor BamB